MSSSSNLEMGTPNIDYIDFKSIEIEEIPIEPDPKDDPAPTPTPEPEPQPTPQPEEKTVDTSDINVLMYLTIALGTTVAIVRETKKALNK